MLGFNPLSTTPLSEEARHAVAVAGTVFPGWLSPNEPSRRAIIAASALLAISSQPTFVPQQIAAPVNTDTLGWLQQFDGGKAIKLKQLRDQSAAWPAQNPVVANVTPSDLGWLSPRDSRPASRLSPRYGFTIGYGQQIQSLGWFVGFAPQQFKAGPKQRNDAPVWPAQAFLAATVTPSDLGWLSPNVSRATPPRNALALANTFAIGQFTQPVAPALDYGWYGNFNHSQGKPPSKQRGNDIAQAVYVPPVVETLNAGWLQPTQGQKPRSAKPDLSSGLAWSPQIVEAPAVVQSLGWFSAWPATIKARSFNAAAQSPQPALLRPIPAIQGVLIHPITGQATSYRIVGMATGYRITGCSNDVIAVGKANGFNVEGKI